MGATQDGAIADAERRSHRLAGFIGESAWTVGFGRKETMNDELCLEDDGDIGIDWATPERDMLTMSLNQRGGISYAVLLSDGTKVHGKCQMHPLAFVVLAKLVTPDAEITGPALLRSPGSTPG